MASMYDVARRAGVALSTVSYAINGSRPVSKQTMQRIQQAMAELGYRPNALARGLASRRSRNIGLIFPALERGLGITELEFVTAAAETASENGYHLVLWSTGVDDTETLARLTQQSLVDGVVVMEVHLDDVRVDMLRAHGLPFCLIGRTADSSGDTYVDIDFDTTTREAVAYLAGLGHTSIAFISHSQESFDAGYGPSVRAAEAFEQAAADAGLRHQLRFCADSPAAGSAVFHDLVQTEPDLTAVIVMNERASAGVMAAVAETGRKVPDDYSVLSIVSSGRVAEMTTPPLTTFSPPSAALARRGVQALIDGLNGTAGPLVQEVQPCELTVRGSTGTSRTTH